MEFLQKTVLEKLVKDGISQKKTVINGKNFKVVKDCVLDRTRFNVITFNNKYFALEEVSQKNRYIDLDKYLLTVASDNERTQNTIDFTNAYLYCTTHGKICQENHEKLGEIYIGGIVILNNNILVLCRERQMPRFYAIISETLKEIPADRIENIIRFQRLSEPQKLSLMGYFQQENWEIHNGIIINPQTLAVPSPLHFEFWKRGRNSKANLGRTLDFDVLSKMLTRTKQDKAGVKYISL